MKIFKYDFQPFFDWVKGSELGELQSINPADDPIRPELSSEFRITHGRKI